MDWKQLLVSITRSVDQELRMRNAYLAAENRILRNQITGRVQLSDGDRQALAEIGQRLGKQTLEEVATIAKPATILAWHRKFVAQKGDGSKRRKALGRPRVDQELEALVVRMARENRSWGYDRIVGALSNLGHRVSDQTVGNILKRQGIPPAPERKKTVTWREFIDSHLAVFGATDFFSSEIWTWYRLVVFFLLSLLSFGRCPLPILGMTALRNALWKWPIPLQSFAWRVAVARWIYTVIEPRSATGAAGR
jgi:transposase